MSFSASVMRAADRDLPLGVRALALYWALDVFAPFGFQQTRLLLRSVGGVVEPHGRFDEAGFETALALLVRTRQSCAAYARAAMASSSASKRADRTASRPSQDEVCTRWIESFFADEANRVAWHLDGPRDCPDCGHDRVLHRSSSAAAPAAGRCCRDLARRC